MRQKVLKLIQEDNFDKDLIAFLRIASSLYYILNFFHDDSEIISEMDEYESLTVFDLHMQRAIAQNPDQDYLKGSFCEVTVLERLFEQQINFVSCESPYEVQNHDQSKVVSHFKGGTPLKGKTPLFILQRSEHIDLILI